MHDKGTQVTGGRDYVCHSMGGDVARTMINIYPGAYHVLILVVLGIKIMKRGFINKLITINLLTMEHILPTWS